MKRAPIFGFLICLGILWGACNRAVTLPDAKFEVPVFPGAKLLDTGYATTADDVREYKTVMWILSSSKELGEITAFYKEKLAGAAEKQTDDGSLMLLYTPAGAKEGEKLTVTFYSNAKIFISQDTQKAK